MARLIVLALLGAALLGPQRGEAQGAPAYQPYAGLGGRAIASLSDAQIADLRAGRGMGLALPAEMNGYPGPSHTLEHAAALDLTAEQRSRTQALFDAMKAEAIPLGERLIAQEATLQRLFASRSVRPETLEDATSAIGRTQAALRTAHLRYHLAMMEVLTPDQVRRYGEIRGYGSTPAGHRHR